MAFWRTKLLLAAIGLGLLFVSKQYFLGVVPCLWLLRAYWTPMRGLACLCAAAVTTLPWRVADFSLFVKSVIAYGFSAPIRFDSLSAFVEVARVTAITNGPVLRVVPAVATLVTAVPLAIAWRPGVDTFLVAIALSLLASFLLSKQAFQNYYFLVGGGLLLAAWDPRYLVTGLAHRTADAELATAEAPPAAAHHAVG